MIKIDRLNTDHFPQISLLDGPSPIQHLFRLEARLGKALRGVRIFIKRDDHSLFAGGGNKLQKLEFLLGAALKDGCDTIITTGGLQSNHARLTAAAAARIGLDCESVLGRTVPRSDPEYEENGNVLLDKLFGAKLHLLAAREIASHFATERALVLTAKGKKVSVIPMGGSSALGALGYARCAEEIIAAQKSLQVKFDKILVPNGSSGTHAGLVAGLSALGQPPELDDVASTPGSLCCWRDACPPTGCVRFDSIELFSI